MYKGGIMKRLYGFTLTELIVALAVVGIIAAVTVPVLVQRYQKDIQVTMLKKMYKDLQDNLIMLQAENINRSFYEVLENSGGALFSDNYIIKKDCSANHPDRDGCFALSYKNLKNEVNDDIDIGDADGYGAIFADGSSMYVVPPTTEEGSATVYIDINGPDKPNIGGRDMFQLEVYNDYSVDVIPPETVQGGNAVQARENLFNSYCRDSAVGHGCFGKILNDDWKMNY